MPHIPLRTNRVAGRVGPALVVALAAFAATARGQNTDRVTLIDRTQVTGEIVAITPGEVEIKDQRTDEPKKLPIERIYEVAFSGEPEGLRNARAMLLRQDDTTALQELDTIDKVELDGASEAVLTEVAFVRAAATARQATAAGTNLEPGAQGLRDFLKKHPQSHHVLRANELLGDLLVQAGRFDEAAAAYGVLAKGPPMFKLRAATAKAGAQYARKNYAEAEREYAAAANTQTDPKDLASTRLKRQAEAGRARCLVRQGKSADAVKAVQGLIQAAKPDDREDRDLLALAYTILGDAHRAAEQDEDALIAFLTVDLVYNTVPDSHAEALFNLVQLWDKKRNPERARDARQSLESVYPESRWIKALGPAGGSG
jgi:TolA-binding protein